MVELLKVIFGGEGPASKMGANPGLCEEEIV